MNSCVDDQFDISLLREYSEILKCYNIDNIVINGVYLQAGHTIKNQGWIIDVSIWDIHFLEFSKKLFPLLKAFNLPFLIPINREIHSMLQSGSIGYKNLGKVVIIYPQDDDQLIEFTQKLIQITKGFKGPDIPTDFHLMNLVYTRYGSYENNTYQDCYIVDHNGKKLSDNANIPPILYDWAPWPFYDIGSPIIDASKKIVNEKYYKVKIVKPDMKGYVIKAIYQHKLLLVKKCIIKEGKKGMGVDSSGREMSDRLIWQYESHRRLSSRLAIPKALDLFQENNNTYLVFEYIHGQSFNDLLPDLYEGNSWYDLSLNRKNLLIDLIIEAIVNVELLHQEGYIHRDLNLDNIFVDKNNKIWLIDMELSFDLNNSNPYPPFEKGTEGYMSPEQRSLMYPSIQQDVYSIGAILIAIFVHMAPYKLNLSDSDKLRRYFMFFFSDLIVTDLIISCLDCEPSKRPNLRTIVSELKSFKTRISNKSSQVIPPSFLHIDFLNKKITNYLFSLLYSGMLSEQNLWSSPVSTTETIVGNIRADRIVYIGFRKGISGVLFAIGQCASVNIHCNSLLSIVDINVNFLVKYLLNEENQLELGLFRGRCGIAMGLCALVEGNIIPSNNFYKSIIRKCFDEIPINLDIASGLAGYGISMLRCRHLLPTSFVINNLHFCFNKISLSQLKNGAWNSDFEDGRKEVLTGFSHGIAGIIWFLLSYGEAYNNQEAITVGLRGLSYLRKRSCKYKRAYQWRLSSNTRQIHEFQNGGYTILLPFIKAYKLTGQEIYRTIVEGTLYSYPVHVIADYTSLERGVAGLGELYLDAWQVFGNEEWYRRATWIIEFLMNSTYSNDVYNYWLQFDPYFPNADLLTGQSGIIHFFIRYCYPDKISYLF